MHAGICIHDLEAVAERTVDGADQGVPTVLVRRAHAADVSCEMPLGNEIGQRRLIQRRRKRIESVTRIDKPGQERLRHDQVSKPERGEQNLAERSDVDDAAGPVHSLQRAQGPAGCVRQHLAHQRRQQTVVAPPDASSRARATCSSAQVTHRWCVAHQRHATHRRKRLRCSIHRSDPLPPTAVDRSAVGSGPVSA